MRPLGQHFLKSPLIAKKIVACCELGVRDQVLEIGPGHGELTKHYVGTVSKIVLVELDPKLCEILKRKWAARKDMQIIQTDFRRLDLETLKFTNPPIILSNLPYYVSKPILSKIINWGGYKRAILMFQKELALRILSQAGDSNFGALSLFFQMNAEGKILFDIPCESFYPPPKVTSCLIKIEPKNFSGKSAERGNLEKLIRMAFKHRRKILLNNLLYLVRSKTKIEEIFYELNISPKARPQEINLETYADLSQKLRDKL